MAGFQGWVWHVGGISGGFGADSGVEEGWGRGDRVREGGEWFRLWGIFGCGAGLGAAGAAVFAAGRAKEAERNGNSGI